MPVGLWDRVGDVDLYPAFE
jgi:hypothetical protein